ncbi:MAG: ATP-dependent zinc metalloprotease FtsH, partial [Pseudolactococcus laudensis]
GRTAEEIIFNAITTGASNDFEQATQLARGMVTQYGMSERLGTVTLEGNSQAVFIGRDYGQTKGYSEYTAQAIDEEVRSIINEAHETARQIIESHREQHKAIALALLEHETLDARQIKSLFETGQMPADNVTESESVEPADFEQTLKAVNEPKVDNLDDDLNKIENQDN